MLSILFSNLYLPSQLVLYRLIMLFELTPTEQTKNDIHKFKIIILGLEKCKDFPILYTRTLHVRFRLFIRRGENTVESMQRIPIKVLL